MNKQRFITIWFLLCATTVFSQHESFYILGQNDTIISTNNNQSTLKSSSFTLPYSTYLSLPFFDDFARTGIFPNATFWADKNVYINNTFCKLPPSIGVATFDVLGSNGLLHSNASTSVFAADTLTSQPFNMMDYVVGAKSNNLYRKHGNSFDRISDSIYYKYNNKFKLTLSYIYFYRSIDTLYRITLIDTIKKNKAGFDSIMTIKHYGKYVASDSLYRTISVIIKNKKRTKDSLQIFTSYGLLIDSIYLKNATGYQYIDGSYNHKQSIANYTEIDSLNLTFSVQAGGMGDSPESADSLILEYYAPYDTNRVLINEVAFNWMEFYNGTDTIANIADYYLFADSILNIKSKIDTLQDSLVTVRFKIPNDGSIETRIPPRGLLTVDASQIPKLKDFNLQIWMLCADSLHKHKIDSIYIADTAYRKTLSYGRPLDGNPFDNKTGLSFMTKNAFNGTWKQTWSISSDELNKDLFYNQIVPIDKSYLKKGFRFRFINFSSLSNDKSHARNEDQWNVDMVSLSANSTPWVQEPDMRIRAVDAKIYEDYTSIPYYHILNIDDSKLQGYFSFDLQNTASTYRKINHYMSVYDQNNPNQNTTQPFGNADIPSSDDVKDTVNFISSISLYEIFTKDTTKIASKYNYSNFDLNLFISDDDSPIHQEYRWNDTVRIRQSFYNYYSYDDGSSEAGYGLRGVEYGQVAFKYSSIKKDTLKSVLMYFNPTMNTTDPVFNLCIWSDRKGKPDSLLAQQNGQHIKYAQGINQYSLYAIDRESVKTQNSCKCIILDSAQTYYIGWIQPTDVLLSVGVDLNNSIKNKLFYNVGQDGWQPSTDNNYHPLMIRPVFDSNPNVMNIHEVSQQSDALTIYPNPTTGMVTIQFDSSNSSSNFDVTVYSVLGMEVIHKKTNSQLDVSDLPNGVYYITAMTENGIVKSGKVMVQR